MATSSAGETWPPVARPSVIAVFSDLSESMRDQLKARGIPLVIVDPTGEPLWGLQWDMAQIRTQQAHQKSTGSPNVKVL